MRNWLQQYFTFTNNERNGVVLLVSLSAVLLLAPSVYLYFKPTPLPTADVAFDKEVEAFNADYKAKEQLTGTSSNSEPAYGNNKANKANTNEEKHSYVANETNKAFTVNINTATAEEFEKLRGIGAVLGARIVKFRGILGGFAAKEQLKEVYGLPDSTYQAIKQQLIVDKSRIAKIDLNTADYKALKAHPYIKADNAKMIEAYRKQHGAFKDLAELKAIVASDSIYKKMVPYLKLN